MSETYTAKDVTVMSELDHIRLNPGVYISSTETPTHLVEEALDNALDEAFPGYCNIIVVQIDTKTKKCVIMDNGRGIPIENDTPKLICTKLFSGSKFKNTKKVYKICTGLNGIGLVAVNALSTEMRLDVCRDNKHVSYLFRKGIEIEKTEESLPTEKRPFSTRIEFLPDKEIFHTLQVNIERIRNRLDIAAMTLPKLNIVLIIDGKKEIIKVNEEKFFEKYCLSTSDNGHSQIIRIKSTSGIQSMDIKFCYSMDGIISQKIMSSVNLLPVEGGGTHVSLFYDILKDIFSNFSKKKNKPFQPQDALIGLRAFLSLTLEKPEFSSAAKEKLSNRKDHLSKLFLEFKTKLERFLNENPKLLDSLLDFFYEYRMRLKGKKFSRETKGKRSSVKLTKLRDCSSMHGELFICEGDSAAGSLIDCRNPEIHAVMPLKGKIPSVVTKKDILQNKEISEIITAFGTGVGKDFDISKLRYDKIIITTDSDPDGWHIACLIIMDLAIIVPEIIKSGRLYLCKTPLYGLVKNKTFKALWTDEEVKEERNKGQQVTRFKGIGEFSPWQLKICVIGNERKLIPIKFTTHLKELVNLFSNSAYKRSLLNDTFILK